MKVKLKTLKNAEEAEEDLDEDSKKFQRSERRGVELKTLKCSKETEKGLAQDATKHQTRKKILTGTKEAEQEEFWLDAKITKEAEKEGFS